MITGHAYHDDLQGIVGHATGVSALGTITIRDTGFPILAFQNANDDIIYYTFQMPHKKRLGEALDSVHLHYYLPTAPTAGDTIMMDYEWTWFNNGDTIPATADWTKSSTTITFTGTEAQYSTGIESIISNLTAPVDEEYSSILLVKLTRNSTGSPSDTYAADLGVLYVDAHFPTDRYGSYNEYAD